MPPCVSLSHYKVTTKGLVSLHGVVGIKYGHVSTARMMSPNKSILQGAGRTPLAKPSTNSAESLYTSSSTTVQIVVLTTENHYLYCADCGHEWEDGHWAHNTCQAAAPAGYRIPHIYKASVMSYSRFGLLILRKSEVFSAKVAYRTATRGSINK